MFNGLTAALRLTMAGAMACSFNAAIAQNQDRLLEEVLVLGSHIPRSDHTSVSPVYTIDRDALQRSGVESIAELLHQYPQVVPDRNAHFGDLANRGGSSSINLRGLGPERNLILLNGHRLGQSGADAVVDINMIPTSLVESVEILTGGASAVYGADAMSGVVNFKLRDRIEGVELAGRHLRTDRGDGDTSDFSLLAGTAFSGGRGNLTGFISTYDREAIHATERRFAPALIHSDAETGELFTAGDPAVSGGRTFFPAILNGELALDGLTFDEQGNPRVATDEDVYNYFPFLDLQYAMQRVTAGGFFDLALTENTTIGASLILTHTDTDIGGPPARVVLPNMVLNLSNPLLTAATREVFANNYDRRGTGFVVQPFLYRPTPVGNRLRSFDRLSSWLNLEFSRRLQDDWHWTLNYTLSDTNMALDQIGGVSNTRLQQALLVDPGTGECFDPTGGCVPADVFGPGRLSDDAAAFIADSPYVTREDARQQAFSLRLNGELPLSTRFILPVLFGLEWRNDDIEYRPDTRLQNPGTFLVTHPVAGDDSVSEAYAEALLPLAKHRPWAEQLELEFGARYSDYSKTGSELTWKSGVNWKPTGHLRIRAAVQRAVRAPNVNESYTPSTEETFAVLGQGLIDPCAASRRPQDFAGYTELCIAQGIAPENLASYEPAFSSIRVEVDRGNPNLQTEIANTYTIGAVWTPEFRHPLSLTIDYYDIRIEDLISKFNGDTALQICFLEPQEGDFCEGIERSAAGDVTQTLASFYNIGHLITKGYDIGLNYLVPHTAPWGWESALEFSLLANKIETFEVLLSTGDGYECAGQFGIPCNYGHVAGLPKNNIMSTLSYQSGPFSASLGFRWLDGLSNAFDIFANPAGVTFNDDIEVGDESYLELNLSWRWRDVLTLSFGVINLTDNEPPLLGRNQIWANTDPATYDVMGRRFHAGFSAKF